MTKKVYQCQECGEVFASNFLSRLFGALMRHGIILEDPAPGPASWLSKCRCPKCNSNQVRIMK